MKQILSSTLMTDRRRESELLGCFWHLCCVILLWGGWDTFHCDHLVCRACTTALHVAECCMAWATQFYGQTTVPKGKRAWNCPGVCHSGLQVLWSILTQKIKLYNNSAKLLLFPFFLHLILRAILWPGQRCVLVCDKLIKKAVIAQCLKQIHLLFFLCQNISLKAGTWVFWHVKNFFKNTSCNILVCSHCQYKTYLCFMF